VSDIVAPVVSEADLARRVCELGAAIGSDYAGREPVVLGVLGGAIPFVADLTRHLDPRLDIDFLSLSRFGVDGRVSIRMDSGTSLAGRHVVVVEDIVDTGLTLAYLIGLLETRDPASLSVVALIDLAAFQDDPDVLARRVFAEPGDTVVG
jgi:hypoxanthine phosphoribosyltransferase